MTAADEQDAPPGGFKPQQTGKNTPPHAATKSAAQGSSVSALAQSAF